MIHQTDPVSAEAAEVLERVQRVLAERQAKGAPLGTPQALQPLADSEVEGLEYYPWKRQLGSRAPVGIRDLQKAPADVFVRRCFRLLLGRDPSEQEALQSAARLAAGWPRALLMAALRWSPEGRARGVRLEWAGSAQREDAAQPATVPSPASTAEGTSPVARERPLLSICITTYNRAAWLRHSLHLMLEQTAPYHGIVEVLVCDNASQDDTEAVAKTFSANPHFNYYRNPKNVGMLGNLGESCKKARGRYVWVIGDDDLLVDGTVERVLAAIARHPDVELLYLNYAYTRFDKPEELADVGQVIRGARAVSPAIRDEYAPRLSQIAAKSNNCFTAIYCIIYREDHARGAYLQDVSGTPFSSLLTSVPTADYVCRHLLDRPAYWVGDPCVVVNMNVSWLRYASLFILERFPELFDLMQENGVPAADVDALRAGHVHNFKRWFKEIYLGTHREHQANFSVERLVRRFGHVPEFQRRWPKLRKTYRKAFQRRSVEDPSLTPERLEALLSERASAAR